MGTCTWRAKANDKLYGVAGPVRDELGESTRSVNGASALVIDDQPLGVRHLL